MNVVVIFDVSSGDQEKAKKILAEKGYYTVWKSNDTRYHLPKNCMWKPNSSVPEVKSEVMSILNASLIGIEKLLVLPASPWAGIEGEKSQ